jgi:hypothetical protein
VPYPSLRLGKPEPDGNAMMLVRRRMPSKQTFSQPIFLACCLPLKVGT